MEHVCVNPEAWFGFFQTGTKRVHWKNKGRWRLAHPRKGGKRGGGNCGMRDEEELNARYASSYGGVTMSKQAKA